MNNKRKNLYITNKNILYIKIKYLILDIFMIMFVLERLNNNKEDIN
jgi:hypothetical protein